MSDPSGTVQASIAPWLSVADGAAAVAFYTSAFGAVVRERLEDGGRVLVANLSVGPADFWVQEDAATTPTALGGLSVRMILAVDDPDAVFARAVAAGATEVNPVSEGHGWRIGRVCDPFGHHWEIGRRLPAE